MWLGSVNGRVGARFGGAHALEGIDSADAAPAPARGRALVPVAPARRVEGPTPVLTRPLAPFLAQLIATKQDAPQTRARRRAGFGAAVAEYAGREAATHFEPGNAIRSV